MQHWMENQVSDGQENNAACEDSSSEESEEVKVCDICGDVGEEKKLVICSNCNDGAEHTYCMRVMIPEVPEGDWLCEECHTEMQIEKEKDILEKSQAMASTISLENKVKGADVSHKELNEEYLRNYTSSKRREDAGIVDKSEPGMCNVCCAPCSSCVHRNCPSFPVGSQEGSAPSDCTSTGKEEDISSCIAGSEAVKKVNASYGREQISSQRNDVFTLETANVEGHSLQSRSDDVPCTYEVDGTSSMDAMKRSSSTTNQVKSSEEIEDVKVCDICGDVGDEEKLAVCSRCSDGAEHIYCMQVMMEEVPDAEWLCETCHTEVEGEKKKNKIETSHLKFGGSKGQSLDGPTNKPVNAENCRSSSENEVNHVSTKRKDEYAVIASSERKNSLSRESSFMLDRKKGKEPAGHVPSSLAFNAFKNPVPPLRGLQPKKTYTAMFDAGQISKSISFNNSKVPKVKQLQIEVPRKPGILAKSASFKKPKSFEPVNKEKPSGLPHAESTMTNPVVSRNARDDILTSILGCRSLTGSPVVPVTSKAESSGQHFNKGNKMTDSNILGVAGAEGARSFLGRSELKKPLRTKGLGSIVLTNAEGSVSMLGQGAQKKISQVPDSLHRVDQIKSPPSLGPNNFNSGQTMQYEHIASTIPELDYIWQGGFELWRTGRSPVLCEGLQAHLSCFASPKVLEVAKRFPSKIQLEELPRQNLWPSQFHENGPTNDSIGLFFFARDTQSYENHYSKLVKNMRKDDLALRGNIETAELLIFASNTLSKNFQRWNMFHFLWGVFRVRRKDALNLPPDVATYANHQGFSNGLKSSFHSSGEKPLEGQSHDSFTASFPTNNSSAYSDFVSAPARKNKRLAYSEQKEKIWDSSDGNGCNVNFDVNMEQNTCYVSPIHEKGNESTTIKLNNADHLMDGNNVNATEVSSGNINTISHVSGGPHKRNIEVANWDDKVNGRSEHKKIKLDSDGSVTPG